MGFLIFILILFGIPALEIYVMIEVGTEIGALQTVGLILLTAALGGLLFRIQGLSALRRVQTHLEAKEMPVGDLLSGIGILLAALLLFIPGFVTDALGFLLFIPPLRTVLMVGLLAQLIKNGSRINVGGLGSGRMGGGMGGRAGAAGMRRGPDGSPVIDGDFEDLTDGPTPHDPANDTAKDPAKDRAGGQNSTLPPSETDHRKP
jgi:UPF0716 protein FxsA